jgi:hypothetical protein
MTIENFEMNKLRKSLDKDVNKLVEKHIKFMKPKLGIDT